MSAYWATAGFSYLKYLGRCTTVMRQAIKEPMKTKLLEGERVTYKKFMVKEGVEKYGKGFNARLGVLSNVFV
eukprot:1393687-Amorphochlora_amoeboformis.AAC.1